MIAIIGAGAIGGLVAAYLKDRGKDVSLVGHPASVEAIEEKGLEIQGVRGNFKVRIDISKKLRYSPDLIILATKTQDIEAALEENLEFIQDKIILTTQNGTRADSIVAKIIDRKNIVSSIVMFGSTYLDRGRIIHNFEGKWILGRPFIKNDSKTEELAAALNEIFPVVISDDILGMKWLKLFVNANNCLAAILGESMQEIFRDLDICKISIRIWQEGLDIVNKAGVKLCSLPDFPLERLLKLTGLPLDESARIFSGIMTNLSKEPLDGSILQSIKRGRPSEIDYINGEFVKLAREHNLKASLNEELIEMVHQVEDRKKFFSKEELLNRTKQFLS